MPEFFWVFPPAYMKEVPQEMSDLIREVPGPFTVQQPQRKFKNCEEARKESFRLLVLLKRSAIDEKTEQIADAGLKLMGLSPSEIDDLKLQ